MLLDADGNPTGSNTQAADVLMRAKTGKAPDIHGVKAELYKIAPYESACMWLPVFAHASCTCQEPFDFKGGCAIAISK
eukprot:10338440-Karenia_brevis.AAC.1